MSNRAQRRAAQKQQPAIIRGKSNQERITMLCKQGISPEMLDKAYQDGYRRDCRRDGKKEKENAVE